MRPYLCATQKFWGDDALKKWKKKTKGEYSKISELPLQKISAVPRNYLGIPVHVPRPGL